MDNPRCEKLHISLTVIYIIYISFLSGSSGQFDTDFTLQNIWGRLPQPGLRSIIQCFSSDETQSKIKYSRKIDTGQGPRLPKSSQQFLQGKPVFARILLMPSEDQLKRFGAFQCKVNKQGVTTEIVALKLPPRSLAELDATETYQVAHVGEDVDIEVTVLKEFDLPLRWRHNGKIELEEWNDQHKIRLTNVQKSNSGVYECFYEGRRNESVHAIMRLIVRDCPAGFYGNSCEEECPICYNGGVCHDKWGVCICPEGFTGQSCEQACGGNHFGSDCSKQCSPQQNNSNMDEGCAHHLFCKPDPCGCLCAPGFKGPECMDHCEPGWYGADCKQPCHCAYGMSSCNRITGACEGGCARGWRGNSCQIDDPTATPGSFVETTTMTYCPAGMYGPSCERNCHCAGNKMCDVISGQCPSGCERGWGGPTCSACSSGRFGDNCEFSCHCDGGNYNCDKDGYCYSGCEAGWAGFTCQQECTSGRFGPNCASACHCLEGPDVCNKFTGDCNGDCQPGFMGKDCQTLCPQKLYGVNCFNVCSCFNGGHCNRIDGTCSCEGRWRGSVCNESEPQIIAATDEEVNTGQHVFISCTADAVPEPEMNITSSEFPSLPFNIRSLEKNQYQAVMKVKPFKNGDIEFSCSSKNKHGFDSKIIILSVIDPPILISEPTLVEATNSSLRVEWREWIFGEDTGGRRGDKVEYMVVYRKLGAKLWEMHEGWKSECSTLIEHLEPNRRYEIATKCKRPGKGGEGEAGPHITVRTKCGVPLPDAIPQGFLPDIIAPTYVRLFWTPPSEVPLRCALSGYLLTYHLEDAERNDEWNLDIRNVTNKAELHNLTPNTLYVLHLFPVTASGPSNYFAELIIHTSESVPDPVQDLQCQALNLPELLSVTWTAPAVTNGQIKDYLITYELTNRGQCGEVFGDNDFSGQRSSLSTVNEITLQNLFPYSTYSVSVIARTAAGEGTPVLISGITSEGGPDFGPPNLRVVSVTSTSLEYQWDPIPCKTANGVIMGYEYTLMASELVEVLEMPHYGKSKRAADIEIGSEITRVEGLELRLEGLLPNVEYGLAVRGYTKVEPGPFTDFLFHRTDEAAPAVPRGFVVDYVTSSQMSTSWSPPIPSHGKIQSYRLRYRISDGTISPIDVVYNASSINSAKNRLTGDVIGLKPATDYYLKIQASTKGGWGNWSLEILGRTSDDVPEAPSKVMMNDSRNTTLKISWRPPVVTNGVIIGYKITWKPASTLDLRYDFSSVTPLEANTTDHLNVVLDNLHPSTEYFVEVRALTNAGYGPAGSVLCWTIILGDHVSPSVKTLDMEATNESIPIIFSTTGKSSVYKYQVIVEDPRNTKPIDESLLDAYDIAVVQQDLPYYIAAQIDPENVSDTGNQTFVVGDRKIWGGYKNVHLNSGHKYRIRLRTLVRNDQKLKSVLSDPKEHLAVTSVVQVDHQNHRKIFGMNILVFVFILISVLVLICIIIFFTVLVVYQKRHKKNNSKPSSTRDSGLSESMTWSVMYKVSENEAIDGPLVTDGLNLVPITDKTLSLKKSKSDGKICHGIRIETLAEYLYNPNTCSRLVEEFKQLAAGQTTSWTIARKSVNLKKNRYGNILPYDRCRVVLHSEPNVSDSDYINASYVDGYKRPREYIVTQGPLDSTIGDFWQMVWQENAPVIVMVTNLIENGKKKCSQYWPDESIVSGNFHILLIHTQEASDFVIRTILMRKIDESQTQRVLQYQFTGWPDRNIPSSPCFLLKMIKRVRADHPVLGGPMIIHCSAGAGRSGTYVALDALLQQAEEEKRVDIFRFVNSARLQRISLVQTMEQYIFIHEALLEAIHYEDTAVPLDRISMCLTELTQYASLDPKSLIRRQFQMLKKTQKTVDVNCCSTALSEYNIFKNRDPMTVPADSARVTLIQEFDTKKVDNYINAVAVDGFRHKNKYLVTQMPMHHTVEDFWQMIDQYKSSVILMLNDYDDEDSVNIGLYWPKNGQDCYGNFEVQVVTFEDQGDIIIRIMKLINYKQPSSEPHTVIQLQYKDWIPGQLTPKKPSSMLNLLHIVNLWYDRSNGGPITVHCIDGATRSGLFCASAYICDQMKTEGILDVYQVVKHIRTNRPEFIAAMEQFKFCFEIANEIVDSVVSISKPSQQTLKRLSYKI